MEVIQLDPPLVVLRIIVPANFVESGNDSQAVAQPNLSLRKKSDSILLNIPEF
jgi:hypothetical protein